MRQPIATHYTQQGSLQELNACQFTRLQLHSQATPSLECGLIIVKNSDKESKRK